MNDYNNNNNNDPEGDNNNAVHCTVDHSQILSYFFI